MNMFDSVLNRIISDPFGAALAVAICMLVTLIVFIFADALWRSRVMLTRESRYIVSVVVDKDELGFTYSVLDTTAGNVEVVSNVHISCTSPEDTHDTISRIYNSYGVEE